jgi:hypothetical protein
VLPPFTGGLHCGQHFTGKGTTGKGACSRRLPGGLHCGNAPAGYGTQTELVVPPFIGGLH